MPPLAVTSPHEKGRVQRKDDYSHMGIKGYTRKEKEGIKTKIYDEKKKASKRLHWLINANFKNDAKIKMSYENCTSKAETSLSTISK